VTISPGFRLLMSTSTGAPAAFALADGASDAAKGTTVATTLVIGKDEKGEA